MTKHRTQADLEVDGFAVVSGDGATRLELPRAALAELAGAVGRIEYRAHDVTLDSVQGRFGPLFWNAEAAGAGGLSVREREGLFELTIGRVELPRGVAMTQAAGGGIELVAPYASLADVRLHLPDLRALRGAPTSEEAEPAGPQPLRQERLRFLDAVKGALAFRLEVVLDLPVLGKRTLDQPVRVEIKDGAFDYRALDDGLTWLEGAFLDLGVDDGRFKVGWSVPLFATNEIISWALAPDAMALAVFNRIPLRVLADVRLGKGDKPKGNGKGKGDRPKEADRADRPKEEAKGEGKRRLRSMRLGAIDVRLSMVAPRSVEVAGGTILFGGDDAPGLVDLAVEGALVHPPAPGAIRGKIGALDLTLKDVHLGGATLTADRLHVDSIDAIEVTFDGFTPTSLTVDLHRVSITNMALVIG